jgi:competence ComEA-like helix-hairpin-helix protein
LDAYRAAQNSLLTEMQTFYNAVRSAIDAGRITINNGRISAAANWNQNTTTPYPAFDFTLNQLSPFDKFALLQQKEGHTYGSNPWFIGAWEMLNHWSPNGSSWWGHCNGWAAAAILMTEPRAPKPVAFGSTNQWTMDLSVADQKGLLSETNYSTLSNFYGARYNGDEGDDITDLSPKAVIQILRTYIGERGVPLVFDNTAGDEVWNFPAWRYTLTLNETTTGGASAATGLVNINTAGRAELMTLDLINEIRADRIIAYRQQRGPFQTTQSITNVRGIGMGIYNRIKEKITVSASSSPRTFSGTIAVQFATDGVDYAHVDSNPESPQGFQDTWDFTLQASPAGEIISGTWAQNDKHPDFAWVPYTNTVNTGSSENNYLHWLNLKSYLGDAIVRQ